MPFGKVGGLRARKNITREGHKLVGRVWLVLGGCRSGVVARSMFLDRGGGKVEEGVEKPSLYLGRTGLFGFDSCLFVVVFELRGRNGAAGASIQMSLVVFCGDGIGALGRRRKGRGEGSYGVWYVIMLFGPLWRFGASEVLSRGRWGWSEG